MQNWALHLPATLALVVAVAISAFGVGFTLRMFLRHLRRDLRSIRLGPLVWFEIVPENRGSSTARTPADQVQSVRSLAEALSSHWPYFGRGVCSVVWNKGTDGLLRMYVGVDDKHTGTNYSLVQQLAIGLNCRAERHAAAPKIPTRVVELAYRNQFTISSVRRVPEMVGNVGRALSDARDLTGALVVTLDTMRKSETRRQVANLTEEQVMNAGHSALYSSGLDQIRAMTEPGIRASIAGCSGDGSRETAQGILKVALGAIGTLGLSCNTRDPSTHHTKQALWVTSASAVLLAIVTVVGWLPIPVSMVTVLPLLPCILLAATNSPLLSRIWFARRLELGEVVVPSFSYFSPRWWAHSRVRARRTDAGGSTKVDNKIAPPSCKQVVPLYPGSLTEIITMPVDAVDIAAEATPLVGLPSNLEHRDGVYCGSSGTNQLVTYSLQDLNHGLFVVGAPGSGKTNLLLVKFGGVCDRIRRGMTDGLQITPIWAETKGEGAYTAWALAREDPSALFVDAHNPQSAYRLALEGPRIVDGATPAQIRSSAEILTSALQFAYGDGIRAASREALDHAIRVAMLLRPEELKFLELDGPVDVLYPNIIQLAYLILGGDHDLQVGSKLLKMRRSDLEASDPRDFLLAESLGTLQKYLDPKLRGKFEQQVAAPLNKLSELRNASNFWTPDGNREDVSVDQLVHQAAPVVLNMGPYWDAGEMMFQQDGISSGTNRRLLLATNYVMWQYVKTACSGWASMGRRTPIYCDEVADIAVNSDSPDVPNVFADVSKEGRSRGMAYFCAAQNLSQMPWQARHEALAFTSKVWFAMGNQEDVAIAHEDLGMNEGRSAFTRYNIANLPMGVGVARLRQGDSRTPPFTLIVPRAAEFVQHLRSSTYLEEAVASYSTAYPVTRKLGV